MSNEELVSHIRMLREKVGEIYPILVDGEGKVIDGFHRLEAYPDWTRKTVEPANRYEEALIWFAAHKRRGITTKEVKVRLITMAEELLKQGVDKGDISTRIAEDTGYTLQRVLSLLPAKYKLKVKRISGRKGATAKRLYKEKIGKEVKKTKRPTKYLCPVCGTALAFVGDLLVPYHEAIKR